MGQRVEYEALIGSRYEQYLIKLRLVFGFLSGSGGSDFKAFRDFLRRNGLWDKEKAPVALSLVDITWDRKTVQMGSFARKLDAESSDESARELLYVHMKNQNILLVKYVLEALDIESGGRLHSVHELYRMVTSYVYPGDYITLPNFQAWIEWIAATGYIKMVGIRWALSDKGLEAVGELKVMDVEEILEDLEEESLEDADGSEEASDDWGVPDSSPPPSKPAVEEVSQPAVEKTLNSDPSSSSGDEEWYDTPPEANPPTLEDIEAAEASFMEQFADMDEAPTEEGTGTAEGAGSAEANRPSTPAMPLQATGLIQPLVRSVAAPGLAVIHGGEDASVMVEKIVGWWNTLGDWPVLTARELGFTIDESAEPEKCVLELAALAVIIEGLEPQPQIFAFAQALRDAEFFKALNRAKSAPQILGALDSVSSEPWMRGLRERLVYMSGVHNRFTSQTSLLEKIETAKTPREAVLVVRDGLFGEDFAEAPFWVLRELVKLGLVNSPVAQQVAVVPSRRLLRNAAALGLTPRSDVASFEELISVAQVVAALFGADSGYGEALEVMDRALSLGA